MKILQAENYNEKRIVTARGSGSKGYWQTNIDLYHHRNQQCDNCMEILPQAIDVGQEKLGF